MNTFTRRMALLAAATAFLVGTATHADEPLGSKPIRVINPYAAGGVVDILTRALVEKIGATTGTTFVVESKPGGAGNIGTDFVAQAAADGATWLIATTSNAANMALIPGIRTDLLRELVPVAQFAVSPNYFVVPSSSPARTLADYVALAKSQPGKLNYGSAGTGSTPHLGFELFKHIAGIDVVAVPYRGAPPIIPDLLAGSLSATYMPAPLAIAQAPSGKVRVLAAVSESRTKDFPNVPTLAEAGYPKALVAPWFTVMVPAGTPAPMRARIEAEVKKALATPEVVTRFESAGAAPAFMAGAEAGRKIAQEIESWRALVRATGLKAE